MTQICLIGFGEVGQILASDLAGKGELSAFDMLFADPSSLREAISLAVRLSSKS